MMQMNDNEHHRITGLEGISWGPLVHHPAPGRLKAGSCVSYSCKVFFFNLHLQVSSDGNSTESLGNLFLGSHPRSQKVFPNIQLNFPYCNLNPLLLVLFPLGTEKSPITTLFIINVFVFEDIIKSPISRLFSRLITALPTFPHLSCFLDIQFFYCSQLDFFTICPQLSWSEVHKTGYSIWSKVLPMLKRVKESLPLTCMQYSC